MNLNSKESIYKAALIFGGAFIVFLLIKPIIFGSSKNSSKPLNASGGSQSSEDPMKDAEIAMAAYEQAVAAGESPVALGELNKELMKDYGMKCAQGSNGRLSVSDLQGKEILVR